MERNKIESSPQARELLELLCNFIVKKPSPMIFLFQNVSYSRLSLSRSLETDIVTSQQTWSGSIFQLLFSLPFMAIESQDVFDKTPITGRANSRFRVSLSFLYQQQHICKGQSEKGASQPLKTCLHQTTWSTIVTGTSERYWTAACLSDGPEEPSIGCESWNDAMILSSSSGDHTSDMKRTMSPRAYALGALAMQLEKIAEYHRHIQLTLDTNFKVFVRQSPVF